MKKAIWFSLLLALPFCFPLHSQEIEPSSEIPIKVVICSGVQDREPIDDLTTVDSSADRVYCWMELILDRLPSTVRHVWYADGEKVGEVALKVTTAPYRTWSAKRIRPGHWKIEVLDESGTVLAVKEFVVR